MVKMRKQGVAIPRQMLNDRYTVKHTGRLVVMEVTDQGLCRPVKVARLIAHGKVSGELIDPHLVWAADGRFTLAGFERGTNSAGEQVDYAQSWLCSVRAASVSLDEDATKPLRRARLTR